MKRAKVFEITSLIVLALGCGLVLGAVWFALEAAWIRMIIFGIFGILMWYVSSVFARYAIAASGRQV